MKIREIIGTDAYGTSVKGVVEGLEKLNFQVKAIRVDANQLTSEITLPSIAQIKTPEGLNHFVVIHKITKKRVFIIADPSKDIERVSEHDFQKCFTGVLIVCIPTSEFEKTKFDKQNLFEVFKNLILPQKKLLAITIISSLFLSIIGIVSSLFSKVLMDEIIPYQLKNSLYIFLFVFALVSLFQNILSAFRQHVLLYLSRKIDIPLLLGYYKHIIHLPYFFFVSRKVGDILTRFQDAMTIKDIFTSVSISLVMDIVLSLISALVLWNINPSLFGILLVIVVINIVLLYIFRRPYKKLNYEQMEAGAILNSQLIESMKNIETIKSLNDESQQIEKLENKYVQLLRINHKEGVLKNTQGFTSNFVASLGNIVFMGVGALFIINQKMSIGDLLVFQTLSQYFTEPIQSLVSLQLTFQEAQIAMTRLNELMSLDREDVDIHHKLTDVDLKGDIELKDVFFSYGSRAPVINNLNMYIPYGKKVAIVGESGAGKSTLARLLIKFISAKEGKITISDYNINDISPSYLRKKIAYIPQNIELFTGSILDNLKVGNPDATYEQMLNACRQAGASGFIERLPNRYASYIEENGSNFSGGEKQRLAIARALLNNPDLFLFDEATSNLDSFSEKSIHDLIFKQITKKTVIIIAHRLSTIINCDIIYLMDEGRIIEFGTHSELMKRKGKYASMIDLQFSTEVSVRKDIEFNEEEVKYE